jgi:hypothetical protein
VVGFGLRVGLRGEGWCSEPIAIDDLRASTSRRDDSGDHGVEAVGENVIGERQLCGDGHVVIWSFRFSSWREWNVD